MFGPSEMNLWLKKLFWKDVYMQEKNFPIIRKRMKTFLYMGHNVELMVLSKFQLKFGQDY